MTCEFDQKSFWYHRFYYNILKNEHLHQHISILFEFRKQINRIKHLGYFNFIILNQIKCNSDCLKPSGLIGKWKLESSVNFENFLTKLGLDIYVIGLF